MSCICIPLFYVYSEKRWTSLLRSPPLIDQTLPVTQMTLQALDLKHWFLYSIICVANVLLGFPINSYVIWLIVTGTGNGLAAEFFSLNLSISEMIYSLHSLFDFSAILFQISQNAVNFFQGIATTGRPLFQCLMCVERYLAVVHPVTFLKYKPLRYRVISSVIVWVASLSGYGLATTVRRPT